MVKSSAVCMVQELIKFIKKGLLIIIDKYNGLRDGEKVPKEVQDLANRAEAKYEIVYGIVKNDRNTEGN